LFKKVKTLVLFFFFLFGGTLRWSRGTILRGEVGSDGSAVEKNLLLIPGIPRGGIPKWDPRAGGESKPASSGF